MIMTNAEHEIAAGLPLLPDDVRRRFIMGHCPNHLRGLELGPLALPIADRGTFDVIYVGLPIRDIPRNIRSDADVTWQEGVPLLACVGNRLFGYAVVAHVFEQIPNPLGWIRQVLDCLEEGGRLAILLPHRERSINRYRQDTTFAQVAAWAIENPSVPTPLQVMDFLSQSFDDSGETNYAGPMPAFGEVPRHYTDLQAVEFARFSWNQGKRLDVHCTAWTPNSLHEVFTRLIDASLLEASIAGIYSDVPELSSREFLVVLEKTGAMRGCNAK
jgi:hypothetical protein